MTAPARPVLLDGAMGTELTRRGYQLDAPRWGAGALIDAPSLVSSIHLDYAEAGAEVLRTNTFGLGPGDARWCATAVALARRAAPQARIAGAIGPADPGTPAPQRALHYAQLARALSEAGADLLVAETQTTVNGAQEASAALRALRLPVWVALSCGTDGRTLGGDELRTAIVDADLLVVGCTEVDALPSALAALRLANPTTPLGVLPSTASSRGGVFQADGTAEDAVADAIVAEVARGPVHAVGGCCGTSPSFTALLHARLGDPHA